MYCIASYIAWVFVLKSVSWLLSYQNSMMLKHANDMAMINPCPSQLYV